MMQQNKKELAICLQHVTNYLVNRNWPLAAHDIFLQTTAC